MPLFGSYTASRVAGMTKQNMFGNSRGGFRLSPKLMFAVGLAAIALGKYYCTSSLNPITGEMQHISITTELEIAMGLQSVPQMAEEFGGLSRNAEATALMRQNRDLCVSQKAQPHANQTTTTKSTPQLVRQVF